MPDCRCQRDDCRKKARARQSRALASLCPVGGRGPSIEAEGAAYHLVVAAGRVHSPFAVKIVPLSFSQTSWTLVQCGPSAREWRFCEAFVQFLSTDRLMLSLHAQESRNIRKARSRRAGSDPGPLGDGRAGHSLMWLECTSNAPATLRSPAF